MYSEELSHRISSELSGNNKKPMLLWILDPARRDATALREALGGETIDLRAATEIICSRTPSQLQIMKQTYFARFSTYLEHDIGHHTSGDHQKLLLAYVGIPRYEGPEVDPTIVTHDAEDLYKAGEKRLGTDEKTFIRIFTERSWAHLASVASAYHHMYDRKLEKVIKSETSGNFEFALLTILRCAENPAKYFAKVRGCSENDEPDYGDPYLYVSNLPCGITAKRVKRHFKAKYVCLEKRPCYAALYYSTMESAIKGLKFNGTMWRKHLIRLEWCGRYPNRAICVTGFDTSQKAKKIRRLLASHFGSCGIINRISIRTHHFAALPMGKKAGDATGKAFIEFESYQSLIKAILLDGSKINGFTLQIQVVKKSKPVLRPKPSLWQGKRIMFPEDDIHSPWQGKRIVFNTDSDDE